MDEAVSIEELTEEMDELGRTKLALAMARVECKRLRARLADLENAAAPTTQTQRESIGG